MVTYNGAYAHCGANKGVRATFNALGNPQPGTFWISQSFPNSLWAQVGFFNVGWFYQVWNLNGPTLLKSFKSSSQKTQDVSQGTHVFEISLQGGHGSWGFLVDGRKIGGYGIGSDTGDGDFLLTNEFASGPEIGLFTDAQALINGVWQPAPSASAYISGTPAIGLAGHLQDPTLPPGSLRIGGAASVTNGTQLW